MPRAGSVQLAAYDEANSDARTRSVSIANAVPPPIEFTIYESLSNVEGDWRAFEQQADCTVFQTFDWLSTWQRHIGARGGVRPAIIVGRAGGEVLLILPLATQKIAFARELVWLGSDLCDYNAPLLAPRFSSSLGTRQFHEVWQHIVATLRSRPRLSYDLVRLEKMPGDVGSQPNPMLNSWRNGKPERGLSHAAHGTVGGVLYGQALLGDAPARPHEAQAARRTRRSRARASRR